MESLSVGIIGCGYITNKVHVTGWRKQKSVQIKAVCDKNTEFAEITARKVGPETRSYKNAIDMLEKEHLDLVDICVPPQAHYSVAMEAIGHGCHVVIEKPMALNLKEADAMIAASEKNGTRIFVTHSSLFNPVVKKAVSLVEKGEIGDLVAVDIIYPGISSEAWILDKNHWSHRLPGGAFGESLPHPLYLAQAFLHRLDVKAVIARKLTDYEWLHTDALWVLLDGYNATGTIYMGWNSPRNIANVNIYGSKADLHLDLMTLTLVKNKTRANNPVSYAGYNLGQSLQILAGTAGAAVKLISGTFSGGHSAMIPEIVKSIMNDTEFPVRLEDVREVVKAQEEICLQIEEARKVNELERVS